VRITFRSQDLRDLCSSSSAIDRAFGRVTGAVIRQRLFEISGTPTLGGLRALPAVGMRAGLEPGQAIIVVDRTLEILLDVFVDPGRSGPSFTVQEVTIVEFRRPNR